MGTKKKKDQNDEKAAQAVLGNCVSFFGTPGIILVDKDAIFVGKKFPRSCTDRNVTLQTVIPGHNQSLGGTERRRRYFR